MSSNKKTHLAATLTAAALALNTSVAQESPPPAPVAPAASSDLVTLEDFIVRESAANIAGDLMPTSRPVASVFGSQSILETPRSVTVLTPELMQQFQIRDFGDLSKIGAGTHQINYYGVPGIPSLRGAKGSVFFNGIQRGYQRNEMPLSFGSLEGMDVVKGPAPAHFGAALAGGYVNLIPKSPYFDERRGSLQVTVGQYSEYNVQFDVGGPTLMMGLPAAYRISVTGQLADSYYDRIGNDFISLYGSVKAQIAPDVTLFTGAEYFNYKSNENAGWNRPTQGLIDGGRYVIGEPVNLVNPLTGFVDRTQLFGSDARLVVPFSVVNNALGAGTVTPAQVALMNNIPGQGYQYTTNYLNAGGPVFTTPISGSTVLSDNLDFANSQNFFWFGDLEFTGNPDRSVKNQTIIDLIETDKLSSYGYAFQSRQFVFENKTSITEEIERLNTTVTYGTSMRFVSAEQLQDFWDEPFGRRDISSGRISANSRVPAGGPSFESQGINYWHGGFGGVGANVKSNLFQASAFAYTHTKFTEQLSTFLSGVVAYAPFEVTAPDAWKSGLTQAQIDGYPSVKDEVIYFNVGASPQFKLNDHVTFYVTAQTGTAVEPEQGGAIKGRSNFSKNKLLEAGVKTSLIDNRLFTSVSVYQWEQSLFSSIQNRVTELEGEGVEFEATYTPTQALSLIGSIGAQRVTLVSPAGFRALPLDEAGWALNGGTLQATTTNILPNNPDRIFPGIPEVQVKLFGIYKFGNGLFANLGGVFSQAYYHNIERTMRIPASYVFNGSIGYSGKNWEISLSIDNITDEDYFLGSDPIFAANTLITKAPERNFRVSTTYKF
jgi:iron complex outermembrane receptor protein